MCTCVYYGSLAARNLRCKEGTFSTSTKQHFKTLPFRISSNVDLLTDSLLRDVYNLLLAFIVYYQSYTKHCTNDSYCSKSCQLNLKKIATLEMTKKIVKYLLMLRAVLNF